MSASKRKRSNKHLALAPLISWLETKSADATYSYTDATDCLFCQYYRSQGLDVCDAGPTDVLLGDNSQILLPPAFNAIAADYPHTFGAALLRAKTANRAA